MPSKGEQPHRLDPVDHELETVAFVRFLSLRDFRIHARRNNLSNNAGARFKRAVKLDPEPTAELLRVADRAPDALARRTQHDTLLDPISAGSHMQPPSCTHGSAIRKDTQPTGCRTLSAIVPLPSREGVRG